MIEDFFSRIENNLYTEILAGLGPIVISVFLFLSKEKKRQIDLSLLFSFVVLVYFYEFLAIYVLVDKQFNASVHQLIGDTDFKGWNLWVTNFFNFHLSKILLLIYLHQLIYSRTKKKVILVLIWTFVAVCTIVQVFGWYPLYDFQPPIYFLGNASLIFGCGLYFIDVISEEKHLEVDLIKNWNFWIVTLILFQSALSFLSDIAFDYLVFNDLDLYFFFNYISMVLYLLLFIFIGLYFFFEARKSKNNIIQHAA